MEEKSFRMMKSVGGGNIALGVIMIVTGLVCGILTIVNGGRLLKGKADRLF